MRSIKETALAFDRACQKASVRYALVGGFAVMAWGQPRATTDVDALARLDGVRLESFANALENEGLRVAVEDLKDVMGRGGHATIFDTRSAYHVDLKPARSSDERDQVEAAQTVPFEGGQLRVASAEHTIAYKLLYGSERDVQDARSILARLGPDLDKALLRVLAEKLGIGAKLEALLQEDSRGSRATM